MNTIKSVSKNVRISKIDKTFKTRDYEVELNELGSVGVVDWGKRTAVSFHSSESAKVEVRQFHYDNKKAYSRDFVTVRFEDRTNRNHDSMISFMTFEQAAKLRDQLNALDI